MNITTMDDISQALQEQAGKPPPPVRQWLNHTLYEERQRWILWLPVAMGLGIWFYFALPYEPPLYAGFVSLATLLLPVMRKRKKLWLRTLLLALFFAALGFTAVQFERWRTGTQPLTQQTRVIPIRGTIAEIIDTDRAMKIVLSDIQPADNAERRRALPARIRVSLKRPDPTLQIGQRVELRAGLFPLPQPALPGGFDFSRHFYFQGIGAVGFALQPIQILEESSEGTLKSRLQDVRLEMARTIRETLQDNYSGPVAAALITGDRAAIAPEVKDAMRSAGLAHMLAISGLHLGLVAAIFFFFIRYLLLAVPGWALHHPIKKWAAGLALLGSLGYLALAGFPVSAQRAYIMVALVLGAVMLDRQVMPMRSIALAAISIMLIAPSYLLSPSFQLSFAATIAIVAVIEGYALRKQNKPWLRESLLYKPLLYFGGIILTSFVASMATTPFVIFHFNQFTLWDVLGNLGASAILSLWVMPCAVLSMLTLPFGLADLPLWLMGVGVEGILSIAFWVSNLPHALLYVPTLPDYGMALIILGGCWLCFWQARWRWAGMPFIAAGMASLLLVAPPDLLISAEAEQIALQDESGEGYRMIRGSTRNFRAGMWQEALGLESWLDKEGENSLHCDGLGCMLQRGGLAIALPNTPTALAEDCFHADLIISSFYHDCESDALLLERPRKTTALWLQEGEMTLRQAESYVDRLRK